MSGSSSAWLLCLRGDLLCQDIQNGRILNTKKVE